MIFNSFFVFASKIGRKNLWLKHSRFGSKFIVPLMKKINYHLDANKENPKNICYFDNNKERMEKIVSWLADEESKKTFLGIIKFRCHKKKNDFISHGADTQYFINDFFKWSENEVLIDCGAFDGDTIDKFISLHPKYNEIIAFEPEAKNYEKLQQKYVSNPKIRLINTGVSDKNGELFFLSNNSGMVIAVSSPSDNTISIPVKSIDSLELPYVSIIKMDIEGGEMQALKGARDTILQHKPKLAICIYHSNDDMLQIAEYIHELLPEYKLYVRHHGEDYTYHETVIYAQMENLLNASSSEKQREAI